MAQAMRPRIDVEDGSLFCAECNSIIQLPDLEPIVCRECTASWTFEEAHLADIIIQHATKPKPNPGWARNINETKSTALSKQSTRATIDEACPRCGYPQLSYYTMQLRSADEGQTVFYECMQCGHKFSQNN